MMRNKRLRNKRKHSLPAAALAAVLVLVPIGSLIAQGTNDKKKPSAKVVTTTVAPMEESKRAVHALNRLTFGPRPGEAERVAKLGIQKWIEQQLDPEKIDDAVVQARLAPFRTLKMDNKEIVANYPPPAVLQAIAAGRAPMPTDPKTRAVYESQLAIYKARVANRNQNENAE
ncbi:MAG: DUF1800 family protein, partial [Terriglobales bacterium]